MTKPDTFNYSYDPVCELMPDDGQNLQYHAVDILNGLVHPPLDNAEREQLVSFCYRQFQEGLREFLASDILERAVGAVGLDGAFKDILAAASMDMTLHKLLGRMSGSIRYHTIEGHRLVYDGNNAFTFHREGA